ncbi:MAG: SPOR domain-containing protein [Xanthomonadaceae bacterium]|nr:SPOR domain-containing protein [Xanthomonadaceae bacterium]MDE1885544.1 SPOR domain-containing protein [Xanthomonadaceae bacterium]MDE2083367.1 SPOR domain-containing protein [Xanthomonadaceae bacterium]
MFSRILFLLLLALNIGVAAWLFFAPQPQARAFAPTDPGVAELTLLSERDRGGEASAAELASAPEAAADLRNETCVSIGPFPTQADMRAALNSLTPLVPRIQYRDAHTTETRGFWVFLSAQPSREKALALARALSNKGVRDYYVVTAGDQQNTISLGLFHEQVNAQKRLNEIAALGFAPQLIARTEDLPVYWIDFAENGKRPVDWRSHVNPQLDLRQQSVTCF